MLCTTELLLSVVKYSRKVSLERKLKETTIDWTEGKCMWMLFMTEHKESFHGLRYLFP